MSSPRLSPGLRRVLAGGLTGLAALLGPALLDLWASSALESAVQRSLGARLGARVAVDRVLLMSPTRLRLEALRILWAGPGTSRLDSPRVDLAFSPGSVLRLRPALAEASLSGGRFRWERPDAKASLRRLEQRLRGRTASGARAKRPRGGAARIDVELDQVVVRELGSRSGIAPTLLEASALRLQREAGGRWRLGAARAFAGFGTGARLELRRLRLRGLERSASGPRLTWLRVGSGRWTPAGAGPGRTFALVVDELAPDLLQVRLDSLGEGPTDRLLTHADIDLRKRTLASRLQVDDLRLGTLHPWPSPVGLGLRAATLQGSAALRFEGLRSLGAQGAATLTHLAITHSRLAPETVSFAPLRLAGRLRWERRGSRFTFEEASLVTGRLTMRLEGELHLRPLGGRGRVVLPPTDCASLFSALPAGLVPTLRGLQLRGALGGELHVAAESQALDELTLEAIARPHACRVTQDAPRANVAALARPFSFVIRPPGWAPTRLVMGPENPDWVPYFRLGRNVIGAFLAAEDRRFFEHRGFDLENIRRALAADLRSRGFAKGASSITQQVAKNVFLSHRRTLSRKLEEAILTWRLEQTLDKRRLLEIYLNLVEMGPGLFGVRAAARHYFRKEPSRLHPLEAAHLAAITPSPRVYYERFRDGRAGMDWLLHLRWLLYQMHRLAWIDKGTYERARTQDLRLLSYDAPAGTAPAGPAPAGTAPAGPAPVKGPRKPGAAPPRP